MGIADSFRNMADKAKDKVDPDKTKQGIDKAGDKLDDATGGKFSEHVDHGQDAAKSGVDRMHDKDKNQPQ
jgi:antitoxin protein of toxin-antitoxin system